MGTEEPPGRCFPARCGAAWGGYGAAWAAWGAPSRCPRTVRTGNSAIRVFTKHETRDPRPGYCQARGVSQREFPGFHETRNTAFFRNTAFLPSRQTADARRRQARGLQGVIYEARENEWKGVFLNPETGITTFTESRFGSRPGISHNIPLCVGKIRISPCRPSSAPEHCGNRGITNHGFYAFLAAFLRVVARRGTAAWGGYGAAWAAAVPRAGNTAGKVFTNHESRDTKHVFFRLFRPSGVEKCSLLQGRSWVLGRRLTRKAVKRYDGELCRNIS